jgi:translation initiation factor 3 subunit J
MLGCRVFIHLSTLILTDGISSKFVLLFIFGRINQGHGKINLCAAFLKEVIQQCRDVLDDDAITDIIKSCNVIKNEKVQQAKRKVKGQAQKSKKVDKVEKKKAMAIHNDVFGDNDNYDEYDQMGGAYEDDFF